MMTTIARVARELLLFDTSGDVWLGSGLYEYDVVRPISSDRRILIVDRNPATRGVVSRVLSTANYVGVETVSGDHAILAFEDQPAHLVLLNPLIAHEMTIRMVIRWFHDRQPRVPVVLMLTWDMADRWQRQLGADEWIQIPPILDDLVGMIQRLTDQHTVT